MAHVFLSYSKKDRGHMQRLRADLRAKGLDVWTDETGLRPGTPDWEAAIAREIDKAGCLVAVLSPDAAKSKWVAIELAYAEERGIQIYPFLTRGDPLQAIPFRLTNYQRIDAREDFPSAFSTLLSAIRNHLSEQLQREEEERKRLEAEERQRLEAEERQRLEAEERKRLEAEERRRLEAEERQRLAAEERQRLEAEERQRLEAEEPQRGKGEAGRSFLGLRGIALILAIAAIVVCVLSVLVVVVLALLGPAIGNVFSGITEGVWISTSAVAMIYHYGALCL